MGCDNQGNVCRDKASVEDCAYQGSDLEHALLFQKAFFVRCSDWFKK